MTNTKSSSSKITACPECDSGNLHTSGSEVECLSCGWKHVAKKVRTTQPAKAVTGAQVGNPLTQAQQTQPAPTVQAVGASIAAQLVAAVQAAPAPKVERKPRQAPTTLFSLTAKGAAFSPNPERARVTKDKNQNSWLAVKALFGGEDAKVSLADIWAAIPTHRDFVGYAKRSGWLAPVSQ